MILSRLYRRLYWLPSDLRVWRRYPEIKRVLIIGETPGDNLLLSTLGWELHRRNLGHLLIATPHPELFIGHPGVARTTSLDWNLLPAFGRLGIQAASPFYTQALRLDYEQPPSRHIIAELCHRGGLQGDIALRPYLVLTPAEKSAADWARGAIVMQSSGLGGGHAMRNKEWGAERFQFVATALGREHSIVQIGSPSDPALAGARDLRGRTSFRESGAILSQAAAFVGLVGFPMHLARAVDCPAVIVYGGRERPDQSGYICNENLYTPLACAPCWRYQGCDYDRVCMKRISPESVVEAAGRLLSRPRSPLPVEQAEI